MIEIDLLPLEFREKKKITFVFEEIFKTKLVLTVIGGLVLFHLFNYTLTAIGGKRLNILKKNWERLSFKKEKVDQLKTELGEINEKIPLIEQLISKRILWSPKLNQLSDLTIAGVWLNELNLEAQELSTKKDKVRKTLIIRGSAASRMKDEPALIGRFMQNLKDDPCFSADFTEIELGPIRKRQIMQTEVMDFILICHFKQDSKK